MSQSQGPSQPILAVTIIAKAGNERERLHSALSELARQDPAIRIEAGPIDGQAILSGMSESDLESACNRIVREHEIEIEVGVPKVIYLETIRKAAEAEGKYIRQTGGSGNYGHVKLRLEPLESGIGYQFADEAQASAIPGAFIGPINAGIQAAMKGGILTGDEMVDLRAVLVGGSYHEQDSNEMAFQFAASIAFKEAARKANPVLLEPVMSVEIVVPVQYLGTVIADLNNRRGRIEAVEHRIGSQVIHALAPLVEMLGYTAQRTSNSQAGSSCSIKFARYEAAPPRGWLGDDWPGVTANLPKRPKAGSGSAAAEVDEHWESS